jgi:hypothetical protein
MIFTGATQHQKGFFFKQILHYQSESQRLDVNIRQFRPEWHATAAQQEFSWTYAKQGQNVTSPYIVRVATTHGGSRARLLAYNTIDVNGRSTFLPAGTADALYWRLQRSTTHHAAN